MIMAMEQTAQQWIDDELLAHRRRCTHNVKTSIQLQLSPARWVLPKLLRIIYHNTDQPVETLAPLIRAMLHEQVFSNAGGDPCDCGHLDDSLNETTAMLVRVLERVRRQCLIQPRLA